MELKDLWVELRPGSPSHMVLRGTYGEKIHEAFRMTRQGVRWRFQRIFGEIYISAYESIYVIESLFGTELRQKAIEIAKERVALRKKAQKSGNLEGYRLKTASK